MCFALAGSDDIFLVSAIGFVIGLIIMVTGFWRFLLVQKLKNMPLSRVSWVAGGLVSLFGKARLREPQNSPISDVPSAFWRIVCSYHTNEENGGWEGFYTTQSKTPILLEDETGTIPILPEGADFKFPSNLSFEGSISQRGLVLKEAATMDPRVLKFIETLDPKAKEAFLMHKDRNILVNEYVIREGDPLFVLGSALPADDTPGPGNQETLVVRKGPGDSTMFISDSSERDFVRTLTGHMYLQIFAGLALSGCCLFLLMGGD
jgi:hypothetical protein